jgi:hypothetical protein
MIRLRPISEEQTFSIIPSSYNLTGAILSLVENGTDIAQTNISYSWQLSTNENFVEVTLAASLKEDSIYTLEITKDNDVLYRDMVYATSKVNKNEAFSYPTTYKQHSNGNSEYIIL